MRSRDRGVTVAHPGAATAAAAASLSLALTACSAGATGVDADDADDAAEQQTLTVLAAASLTDVLQQVAADVEADRPGAEVELSFAGSSTIVQQVNEGAPADVIALAGQQSLKPLDDGLADGEPVVFATNSLELVVPADNPAGISSPEDLASDGIRLVVCEEQVPCGSATASLLDRLGIDPPVASYEHDVRATLTKVALGEADVGVVYRTDVAAAGDAVKGVEIPAADNVVSSYPVLALSDSGLATAFVDELTSERGRQHLADAGFGAP